MTDKFHSLAEDKTDPEVVLSVDQEDSLAKIQGQEFGEKKGPLTNHLEAADLKE